MRVVGVDVPDAAREAESRIQQQVGLKVWVSLMANR